MINIKSIRAEKKLQMEKKIYEVGMALFKEKGYANTTLVEIAAVVGISTRTLFKYYPAKEDILFKFSKDHVKMIGRYAARLPAKLEVKEKILNVMLKDIGSMLNSDNFKIHNKEKSGSLLANKFEMENMLYLEGVYQGLLEKEQKRRRLKQKTDCKPAAIVIVGIYRQVTDQLLQNKTTFQYEKFRKSYEQCLDVLWDGIEQKVLT